MVGSKTATPGEPMKTYEYHTVRHADGDDLTNYGRLGWRVVHAAPSASDPLRWNVLLERPTRGAS